MINGLSRYRWMTSRRTMLHLQLSRLWFQSSAFGDNILYSLPMFDGVLHVFVHCPGLEVVGVKCISSMVNSIGGMSIVCILERSLSAVSLLHMLMFLTDPTMNT